MAKPTENRSGETVLQGIGVSPGVAVGPVFLVTREEDSVVSRDVAPGDVPVEIARFEEAVIQTRRQIKMIQENLNRSIGQKDANIFDVHLMVLDDRAFAGEVIEEVERKRKSAEAIVKVVAHRYVEVLGGVEDEYLRERVADVKDVARRIVSNLSGKHGSLLEDLRSKSIVVASDLAPSETAILRKDLVTGFSTDQGSSISHTAIMARALKIPAVVGLGDVSQKVAAGEEVLIDGNKGLFIIHPTPQRLEQYGKLMEARRHIQSGLIGLRDRLAETRDGHRVTIMANIEMVAEIEDVKRYGAEGVGLFRSEYLYLSSRETPTEEEQAAVYEDLAAKLAPAPVVIRTVDIGGDKFAMHGCPYEANPFMGFRAIRFSLSQPDLFKAQIRAILRASRRKNVKIMYPMISSVAEVVRANRIVREAMDELSKRGVEFDEGIDVGAMIEVPSAALTADLIAAHVKFFSLGTNDLVQYTLAVDRVNERVAHLYEPTHPAVLKLIRNTIQAGRERRLPVAVCGEMAGDPILTPLLVGLGVNELSMAPASIPIVKDSIRNMTKTQAEDVARLSVNAQSAEEVVHYCRDLIGRVAPEILDLTA